MTDTAPNQLRLEGFTDERTFFHIVQFVDGFSVGWRFCLPEQFKEVLDIKRADWVGLGEGDRPFVQGRCFTFEAGHTIHDCREAYTQSWTDALKIIRYSVQVVGAAPSAVIAVKDYRTDGEIGVIEDGKAMKDRCQIEFKKKKISWGTVELKLLKKKPDGSGLYEVGHFSTDQEKFVAFLQSGVLRDSLGRIISKECAS